jgi:hypothetical protein
MPTTTTPPPFYNTDTARHWFYYVALEEDFAATDRYVEICGENFKTFSTEYTRLFLSTCSEIDVVLKLFCETIVPKAKLKEMKDYRKVILKAHPDVPKLHVGMRRQFISSQPWKEWAHANPPTWWNDYNAVKHKRDKNYQKANMENVLDALAALYVIVCAVHKSPQTENSLLFNRPTM